MIIHGATPGNMIGAFEPERRRRYDSEFSTCPECGSRMHHTAKLCKTCHYKAKTKGLQVSKKRQIRFDAALALGWTLGDIYGFDSSEEYDPEKDKLPSWEEIVARDPVAYIRWQFAMSDNET